MAEQDTQQPQELLAFLREHRGNEVNFSVINKHFSELLQSEGGSHHEAIKEVQDKYATAYTTAREQGGSAWPEFERYVSELEKCLINNRNEG